MSLRKVTEMGSILDGGAYASMSAQVAPPSSSGGTALVVSKAAGYRLAPSRIQPKYVQEVTSGAAPASAAAPAMMRDATFQASEPSGGIPTAALVAGGAVAVLGLAAVVYKLTR